MGNSSSLRPLFVGWLLRNCELPMLEIDQLSDSSNFHYGDLQGKRGIFRATALFKASQNANRSAICCIKANKSINQQFNATSFPGFECSHILQDQSKDRNAHYFDWTFHFQMMMNARTALCTVTSMQHVQTTMDHLNVHVTSGSLETGLSCQSERRLFKR